MKINIAVLKLKKHRLHDRVQELKALMSREKNPSVVEDIKTELKATLQNLQTAEMGSVFSPIANSKRYKKIAIYDEYSPSYPKSFIEGVWKVSDQEIELNGVKYSFNCDLAYVGDWEKGDSEGDYSVPGGVHSWPGYYAINGEVKSPVAYDEDGELVVEPTLGQLVEIFNNKYKDSYEEGISEVETKKRNY